jgi:hypothetical protein
MTYSNIPTTKPLRLEDIQALVDKLKAGDRPRLPRAVYVRRDAWPDVECRTGEAFCVVDTVEQARGFSGVDIIVTDAPLPRPWMFDDELPDGWTG